MLKLDLDEPVTLQVVEAYSVSMAIMAWDMRRDPLPISGDPIFNTRINTGEI